MTWTKQNTLASLLALTLPSAISLRAEDRLRAGLWENTVTSNGKTITQTHCITPAEAATTNLSAKAMRDSTEKAIAKSGKGTCTLKEFAVVGNTISQVMVCGAASYANTTKYGGNTYETKSTSTTAGVAKVTLLKGRRLGACP